MPKKKKYTLTMRFNEEYSKWIDLKDSYPTGEYETIEDNLENDDELLDDFFKLINIIKSLKKRNYISKEKALDLILSISYYPVGDYLDAIDENGVEVDGKIYYKNY